MSGEAAFGGKRQRRILDRVRHLRLCLTRISFPGVERVILLIGGLVTLAASPLVLRWRYGPAWPRRPFAVLVIVALVYQGLSESIVQIFAFQRYGFLRVQDHYINLGMVVAGLALLGMTLGYIATHAPQPHGNSGDAPDLDKLRASFGWKIPATITLVFAVLTARGEGYNAGAAAAAAPGASIDSAGLTGQFFITAICLTAFAILLRRPQAFISIVIGQSAIIALAGQRLEIIVALVVLSLMASHVGLVPRLRQVVAVTLVAVLAALAIQSVRVSAGRELFATDSGVAQRASALWRGVTNPSFTSDQGTPVLADAALRLNSAGWSGAMIRGLEDRPPVGFRVVTNTVLLAVPSVLYPNKVDDLSDLDRSAENSQIYGLNQPRIDYLPGDATSFLGALGVPGTLGFNFIIGLLFGLLDRWALGRYTLPRLVVVMMATQAAMFFEKGLGYYLLVGRSFLVVVAVVLAASIASRAVRRQASEPGRVPAGR